MNNYSIALSLFAVASCNLACAQDVLPADLNAPFGWAQCSSVSSGDSYSVTGGGAVASPSKVVLVSTGADMRSEISSAIKNNNIIVFDGSKGDFIVGYSIDLNELSNKTIVGINGARLCTKFFLTDEIRNALDAANVKSASTSSGTGGTLSTGTSVSEARELLTRQTLIDLTKDNSEMHRKAGIFNVKKCRNIIIRNIKFVGPGPCDVGGYDLVSSTGTTHLWVDHCDFTDGIDGNFDITEGSDFVTVSWCTFSYTDRAYDHMNTNLVGGSDSKTSDQGKLNVTFAFNVWGYKCNQRMPMARFGTIHMLNNYFNCPGNSNAINPRKQSNFLVEGNYFVSGVKAYGASSDATSCAFSDNYAEDKSTIFTSFGTKVNMPYSYTVEDVQSIPALLTGAKGAGATLAEPLVIGKAGSTAVDAPQNVGGVVSHSYFSLSGQRLAAPIRGCVEVNVNSDGSRVSRVIM